MDVELKIFAEDGVYEGNLILVDGHVPSEVAQIAIGTFGDGGHIEVWADGVRVFDEPATRLPELEQQIAGAVVCSE